MILKTKDKDGKATYLDIDSILGITVMTDKPNKFEIMIGMKGNVMQAEDEAATDILQAFLNVKKDVIYSYQDNKLKKENL